MNDELDGGAGKDREFYLSQAYVRAFGQRDEDAWDPNQGFRANRPRILMLYNYYQSTYLKTPDLFLWAGLGRMAGGAVVSGLDIASALGETFLTQTMVQIGKSIFHDLAWQHEAFLDDPQTAIGLAGQHDAAFPARRSYADAWRAIASGDSGQVADGNRALLENEQFSIIQPLYDKIAASSEASLFSHTRAFTDKIHPYHRDFLVSFPTSDVIIAQDRWAWITEDGGMYAKWVLMPSVSSTERTRLVSLSFDDLLRQNFAPVVGALMSPGADDE